ncbi:MAG: glycosyltransferase family 2 protein [Clostridia bacterium]|nr:glycosyltransferase family 2 protein [Clostridia bacterium]
MLISFIIVAYNAEKHLRNCLESLKCQDYPHKNIEVIFVDGMSTDNTKKIFEEFRDENIVDFNRIIIIDNPKKTLPCGWNVALKEATGEVVLRVDAHAFFEKDFISNNVKEIENGEDIVGGKCISVTKNDTMMEKLLLTAEESIFGCGIADFRRKSKKEYVSTLAFAMYKKKVFDKVGQYNENLARTEDNEMHYRMKKAGFKFLLSPNIKSYRYARNDLKGMAKQKYGNGKWIGITMYYCPKCFSIYHFVPLLFVIALIISSIFMCFNIPFFFIALSSAYLLFNIINLILITIKNKFHIEYLLLPFLFFILHLYYGIGTIVGLIIGPFYKKKRSKGEKQK